MELWRRHKLFITTLFSSLLVTVLVTYAFVALMKDRLETKDLILFTIQFLLVVVGIMYAVATLMMWSRLSAQLRSSMNHSLTEISNLHDFKLLEFIFQGHKIPPVLPSWEELKTEQAWAWRVLHFNHLNLLLCAFNDYKSGIMPLHQWESWAVKGQFLFSNACSAKNDECMEGRRQLDLILRKIEGYPDDFRQWLVDAKIITSDLIGDLPKR